jgi:hypothetical protein
VTAEWLQTALENNLGLVWISEFPEQALRSSLMQTAERDFPDGPARAPAWCISRSWST